MLKKIKIQISGIQSINDQARLETEIDVLKGVKNITVEKKTGETEIDFDDSLISQKEILEKIKTLNYQVKNKLIASPVVGEHIYFVKGMHCASCEILIEKKLLSLDNIKSAEASNSKSQVLIEYEGKEPSADKLNQIFQKENYFFSNQPTISITKQNFSNEAQNTEQKQGKNFFIIASAALLFIIAFFILKNSGLASLINVNSTSSLPTFFFLGLLAGVSSCAALVGGLVLSMSKQWLEMYSERKSTLEKLQPHLMFNIGRIVSYTILGGIIGAIGSKLQISLTFSSILIIAVSVMMFFLALQMLGVKAFRRFQFTMPRFITRHIADETKFQGKYMPFLMGALTFFLPCGFTITAQSLALLSGSALQGALIMLFFALGTLPALLAIGLSAVKFSQKAHLSYRFLKIAGVLVLFFALYNINSQLNVLGFSSFSDLKLNSNQQSVSNKELPPIIDGKQIVKMDASSSGYSPNYLKVKAGIPVRWEITDTGTSGCTNAIIAKGLFSEEIPLTPGQTSIKEFTPKEPGKYKFSCWMGMVSGTIEVVSDTFTQTANAAGTGDNIIPSGAQGCGCGGGGSCGAR